MTRNNNNPSTIQFFASILAVASLGLATAAAASGKPTGNTLNPTGRDVTQSIDPRGLSLFRPTARRTPTGFLYKNPPVPTRYETLGSGWLRYGSIEIGALGSDGTENEARFSEYSDWDSGLILSNINFSMFNPNDGRFVDLSAGSLGREDGYLQVSAGKSGLYRVRARFVETPHLFSTDSRTLYSGVGSEYLALPSGLVRGSNLDSDINTFLSTSSDDLELGLKREKLGLGADWTPNEKWRISADYSLENRDGTRVFGGAFFFPLAPGTPAALLGGVTETIEPIDYTTHDMTLAAAYAVAKYQINVSANVSLFENKKESLTFENPFLLGSVTAGPPAFIPPVPVERGQFALYPDNKALNLKLDFATLLPLRGRLTGGVSWSSMEQDENLLAPTVASGIGGITGLSPIDYDQWNTTDALSRKTADAQIDTTVYHLGIRISPSSRLSAGAKVRYFEKDNKTDYEAFNPLTGQYGYIVMDGGFGNVLPFNSGVFLPGFPGSNWHYKSIPFSYERTNYKLDAKYRLARKVSTTLAFEREEYDREHREVAKTQEDRIRFSLNVRSFDKATIRLSVEYAERDGSDYHSNPYEEFYTEHLPGFVPSGPGEPHTLDEMRKYDLSDREQALASLRINLLLNDAMDLGFTLSTEKNDYDAAYGLQQEERQKFQTEWNYQPSTKGSVYAYYSVELADRDQANINDDGAALGVNNDASAGGAVFPLANAWSIAGDDKTSMFGIGFNHQFTPALSVDSSYSYLDYDGETATSFNSAGALSVQEGSPSNDTSIPDASNVEQTLETSLKFALSSRTSMRVYHRFQKSRIGDWHYRGIDTSAVINKVVLIDDGPQDYQVNIIGLFLQHQFR